MARRIAVNAKVQRPGVCNAAETLLVSAAVAGEFLPLIVGRPRVAPASSRRRRARAQLAGERRRRASDADWDTEYPG